VSLSISGGCFVGREVGVQWFGFEVMQASGAPAPSQSRPTVIVTKISQRGAFMGARVEWNQAKS
jgi:hypothetical protein